MTRKRQHYQYDAHNVRILAVLACVHNNPHISSRQIKREVGIRYRTVLRILKARKYHTTLL